MDAIGLVLKQIFQLKETEKLVTKWSPGGQQIVNKQSPSIIRKRRRRMVLFSSKINKIIQAKRFSIDLDAGLQQVSYQVLQNMSDITCPDSFNIRQNREYGVRSKQH